VPPKSGPATTCVRAQVGASRKGDRVQQGRDEVMICKGLRSLGGATQPLEAPAPALSLPNVSRRLACGLLRLRSGRFQPVIFGFLFLCWRWLRAVMTTKDSPTKASLFLSAVRPPQFVRLVGSRSQARNSVGSEPQRTFGRHISNSEIPQLETNLTLEKSTRATFLIAKKSHIADSLFSGTTRTRRRSATDPLAISNRLRRRLEFDVTPGKQRTACDPNRRKWADLIFAILPLRACVLAQPKRRIPKAASLPPVSSLARFSYGVLWPHESAGELAGIVVGQSRRTKWRKIARDRTARSNRT
jgi:hypothetical protein